MKNLLLISLLLTPALALADRIVPPGPRIDLSARPNTFAALRNRKAMIELQNADYLRSHPATRQINPPGATMQLGKRW